MNELNAILFLFLYLAFAVFSYKMGRNWLQSFLVISYITTMVITPKFFDFFGLTASLGVITYAGIFLATDMMTERYGKAAGFQTVKIGLLTGLFFIVMTQATYFFEPLPFAQGYSDALQSVVNSTLRVVLASLSVYLFAQLFDVWLFHKISEVTKGRFLWLRNNLSTSISQIVDTTLFFTIAFIGTMPMNDFVKVLLVGIGLKLAIAALDTPFIYLARMITPLDLQKK